MKTSLSFLSNFKSLLYWHSYTNYIDGWISKFAFFVPIIGYLILFNDTVVNFIGINEISDKNDELPAVTMQRLRYVYFGLISLGMSNIIYKLAKPFTLTIARTQHDYIREGMSNFSFLDFEEIYESARKAEGEEPLEAWQSFRETFLMSVNPPKGPSGFLNTEPTKLWAEVKEQHEEFLINLLSIGFCHFNNQRSFWLLICLFLSTFGYACLAWPSFLVFLEIVQSSFI